MYDSLDILLEYSIASGLCKALQTNLLPFLMECICRTLFLLVRSCPVQTSHEYITVYQSLHCTLYDLVAYLET